MSYAYLKQPNGKWAVFSDTVDDFVLYDASKEEVIEWEMEQRREQFEEKLDNIESGDHFQRHSFEDALKKSDMTREEFNTGSERGGE